jgi:hypothetical protein
MLGWRVPLRNEGKEVDLASIMLPACDAILHSRAEESSRTTYTAKINLPVIVHAGQLVVGPV